MGRHQAAADRPKPIGECWCLRQRDPRAGHLFLEDRFGAWSRKLHWREFWRRDGCCASRFRRCPVLSTGRGGGVLKPQEGAFVDQALTKRQVAREDLAV